MGKKVLITGAGSGFGKATAIALAARGHTVIATTETEDQASALRADAPELQVEKLDITSESDVSGASKFDVDVLINNAGNAHGLDPIQTGNVDDWDAMLDINVKGLLYVSKAIIPGMTERNSGHIINIGSIAGKEVYPNGNVYCASKHAVDALTNGMRMDLNPFGIKVMGIHPGLVETEFSLVRFKGDEKRAGTVYQGYSPLLAQDIADIVEFALTRPPHVVLADVVVLPTAQASATVIKKKLPQ